ncbi:MAG: helix-turn-helix domain-containing protein, partial [Bradyrhizobium sp.]
MPSAPAKKRPERKRASSGPPAKRAERAADRRQAIIEAAFETFIEKGFAATRLDDVARQAGVAKGTIYLHFRDKQAL